MTEAGILATLSSLAKKIASGRRADVKSLKTLADRKIREIESTHKLFHTLLRMIERATIAFLSELDAATGPKKSIARIDKVLRTVETKREEGMAKRRLQFEEARSFSVSELEEKGIFKRIPDDISKQLHSFMIEYCEYFRGDTHYHHELHRMLEMTCGVVERIRMVYAKELESSADEVNAAHARLRDVVMVIDFYRRSSTERWSSIATEYSKLTKLFREHGLA